MPKGTPKNANGQLQATILKKCDRRTGHHPETTKAGAARDAGEAKGTCQHTCEPSQLSRSGPASRRARPAREAPGHARF